LLKLLIPIIVVIPGIAAFVLYQNGMFQQEMLDAAGVVKPDHAYPVLLNLLPAGLKGMAFAALTAAIVASLAGKANSISTIFTLDIYKQYIAPHASEKQLVRVGRYTIYVAMGIGVILAPQLRVLDQAYQFIQEYSSFSRRVYLRFSFWVCSGKEPLLPLHLTAALLTIPLSTAGKFLAPEVPFLDRMGIIFLILCAVIVVMTLADPKSKHNPKGLEIDRSMFQPGKSFVVGSILICGVIAALYTAFW
jgi:SSS family solute:Na+ symporter